MGRKKSYPPSKIRYDKNYPTISFRLPIELRNQLYEILDKEGISLREFMTNLLQGKAEELNQLKKAKEDAERLRDEIIKLKTEIRVLLESESRFTVPCSKCGKEMWFSSRFPNWKDAQKVLRNAFRDWVCRQCYLELSRLNEFSESKWRV